MKPKVLISACLIGKNVKYNGGNNILNSATLKKLHQKYELISVCPEVDGGLPTPRVPAEISGECVFNKNGQNVTSFFKKGATIALELAKEHNIKFAIFKDGSPSCGVTTIYDGTFSKTKIKGCGITTNLLIKNNIKVYNEFLLI